MMRAAGIEAFGGEVQMLELAAPRSPAPDEVVLAVQALGEVMPDPRGEPVLVHGAGSVTGGLVVQLAALRGATVLATAGPGSAERVRRYGATEVFDYRDADWPVHVQEASRGGVRAAVNAARGGAAAALEAVAADGRLATITGDPPRAERGVTVSDVYVRADGARLAALVTALVDGMLRLHLGTTHPLAEAGVALRTASTGCASGATVLTPST